MRWVQQHGGVVILHFRGQESCFCWFAMYFFVILGSFLCLLSFPFCLSFTVLTSAVLRLEFNRSFILPCFFVQWYEKVLILVAASSHYNNANK